jgi:amino acid transporter
VAYTFVRLTQRFHHSGSVYGFVGATLGPRSGVISGWALTGTYTFYAVVTSMAGGRFASNLLNALGIWKNPPTWSGFLLGAIGMLLVWWLAITPARGGTRVLLAAEGITVTLIIIVIAIVFGKLAGHSAPHGLGVDWSVFRLPSGTPISTIFLGAVFGFLSFAGFEAASTLGEETKRPNRDIPRAILGVAIFGGIYFFVVTAVEVMGFGTSAKGITAFINSTSLIGDLGTAYVASWLGTIITAGAMISAFGCALACTVGASRLVYAMSRDGIMPERFSAISPRRRTPTVAAAAVALSVYVVVAFTWFALRGTPFGLFAQSGVIGTLILLVVYILATIGMVRLVFFTGQTVVRRWEIAIPILGLIVLGYTLFRNVWPLPTGVAWWGPSVAIAWFVIGIIGVLARPGATRRAGQLLTTAEGLGGPVPVAAGQLAREGEVTS